VALIAAQARAPRIPEEEWERHRANIEHLYIHEGFNLRDVVREMSDTYDFQATDKQYKRQLASWVVRKNISTKEMRALVHVPVEKRTVRGNVVTQAKLVRFIRRQKQKTSKLDQEQSQKTPLVATTSPGDVSASGPRSSSPAASVSPSISNISGRKGPAPPLATICWLPRARPSEVKDAMSDSEHALDIESVSHLPWHELNNLLIRIRGPLAALSAS